MAAGKVCSSLCCNFTSSMVGLKALLEPLSELRTQNTWALAINTSKGLMFSRLYRMF